MDGRGVGLSRMFQREGVGVGVVSERGCSWVMLDFGGVIWDVPNISTIRDASQVQ